MNKKRFNCSSCSKELHIEFSDKNKIFAKNKLISDCNGNWFCPNCYKKYGKPDFNEIKELLNTITVRLDKV